MGSCKGGAEIIWPLSRNKLDELILELPKGYAGLGIDKLNTSEMRATDFPVEDSLVITAVWPDLTPPARYEFTTQPVGATMETLVTARAIGSYRGQTLNALEYAFDDAVDLSVRWSCSADIQAASGPVTQALCLKRHHADVKTERFGLKRQGVDFKKYPDYPQHSRSGLPQRDIYYLRAGNVLKTMILCTAEEALTVDDNPQYRVVAQCEHKFIDTRLNALVTVHYRRVYLEQWRDIETAWRKLLDSFIEIQVKSPS